MSKFKLVAKLYVDVDGEISGLGETSVPLEAMEVTNKLNKEWISEALDGIQGILGFYEKE